MEGGISFHEAIYGEVEMAMIKRLLPFILAGILLFSGAAFADVFPIEVRSQYYDSRTASWGTGVIWKFEQVEEGTVSVTQSGSDERLVLLQYDKNGHLIRIEQLIKTGGRTVRMNKPATGPVVLSDGFPVPYDYLSPHEDGVKEVVTKKMAAGVTFSSKSRRETAVISVEQAVAESMVDGQQARKFFGKDLKLVKVVKGQEVLVRQLWPEGGSWWVYEETPMRRSWRILP
jgi:hypothetical protein